VKSALWDHGYFDSPTTYWDRLVAEVTGSWTSNNDSWTSSIYVYIPAWINWTDGRDVWASSITVFNGVSINWTENIDDWQVLIKVTPPDVSIWHENPDIWDALIYVTLQPPVYNAGGSWWFHEWGDRLPNWKARRDAMEEAYANWRYVSDWEWTSHCDTWSGTIETFNIHEETLRRQVRMMFGGVQDNSDQDDEDLLWLL